MIVSAPATSGEILAWLTRSVRPSGNIASVGLMAREVSLSELPDGFDAYMNGSALGRSLVRVQDS